MPVDFSFTPFNGSGPSNADGTSSFRENAKNAGNQARNVQALTNLLNVLKQELAEAEAAERNLGNRAAQGQAQFNDIQNDQKDLKAEFERQRAIGLNTRVNGWTKFPNGTITLRVGEAVLEGHFQYNKFITTNPISPKYVTKLRRSFLESNKKKRVVEKTKITYINPGAQVRLISTFPIYYVVNLLPSTVHAVYAQRTLDGGQSQLTEVPSSYYSVETRIFGPYSCTFVVFPRALSTYDEGWEDEIVVTHTSIVGPNVVSILAWLIQKYTTLQYDVTTFNPLVAKMAYFPAHFVLYDRKNLVQLLEEICFQARLQIWLDDDKFKLRYLGEEQTAVDTITEEDIEFNTLEVSYTRTEDLVTKLVANWKHFYEDDEPNQIILRYNINKYGLHEQTYDFYIYNLYELVQLSATYWIVHKGNTFKTIKFRTPLHKLNLETFDVVNLSFTNKFVANSSVKGIIQSANYSITDNYIEFVVWVPVRIGEMTKYRFTYPDNLSQFDYFPPKDEIILGAIGNPAGADGLKNNTAVGDLPGANTNPQPKANEDQRRNTRAGGPYTHAPRETGSLHPTIAGTAGFTSEGGNPIQQVNPYTLKTPGSSQSNVTPGAGEPYVANYKVGDNIVIDGQSFPIVGSSVVDENGVKQEYYTLSEALGPSTGPNSILLPNQSIISEHTTSEDETQWFDYEDPDIGDEPIFSSLVPGPFDSGGGAGGGIPIKITGGSGNTYTALAYPEGPDGESEAANVIILDIHEDEQIPEDTWLIATVFDGVYYAQPGIWYN